MVSRGQGIATRSSVSGGCFCEVVCDDMLSDPRIGGSICGSFIVFGTLSILLYKPWRRRIDRQRGVKLQIDPNDAIITELAVEELPAQGSRMAEDEPPSKWSGSTTGNKGTKVKGTDVQQNVVAIEE